MPQNINCAAVIGQSVKNVSQSQRGRNSNHRISNKIRKPSGESKVSLIDSSGVTARTPVCDVCEAAETLVVGRTQVRCKNATYQIAAPLRDLWGVEVRSTLSLKALSESLRPQNGDRHIVEALLGHYRTRNACSPKLPLVSKLLRRQWSLAEFVPRRCSTAKECADTAFCVTNTALLW